MKKGRVDRIDHVLRDLQPVALVMRLGHALETVVAQEHVVGRQVGRIAFAKIGPDDAVAVARRIAGDLHAAR